MKSAFKYIFPAMTAFILLSWTGCTDPNAIVDQNIEIVNNNWAYSNKIKYAVKIDNEQTPYNLYLNLRVTGDYKYSNLFVLIYQTNPDKKATGTRYEFKLANPDGEWLGQGSGNLYSYQIPFRLNYKFPAKGVYTIQIEQNMRDNPLHEVSDIGLRVEKAQ
ncbi:gliding motility lipoprotein GldH [Mucilaginibacter sp.]|uniref:gliding motility lipoprotein GldH n=1 Tax=Mucilaginibacter sp. TaxID=1882438 RepID=UPI00262D8810|nr:gliding motility lipoprotein GldH [Mucilaginibacter sp.]